MKEETVRALLEINRRFYEHHAAEFDRTRREPWRGWRRVLEIFAQELPPNPLILDLGCGNGRFAAHLRKHLPCRYLGVDTSLPLLRRGAHRLRSGEGFALVSAEAHSEGLPVREASADAVALFGLMHHIPSRERRRATLEAWGRALRPGGLLCVSFWRFLDYLSPDHAMAWADVEAVTGLAVDLDDLVFWDAPLQWGDRKSKDPTAIRYCHHFADDEVEELTATLDGLEYVEEFTHDGRDRERNLYVVLRRPEPARHS